MAVGKIALISLGVLLVEHCTTVTLTRYTQQRPGVPHAAPTVAVLLTEVLKLLMSATLELTSAGGLGTAAAPRELYAAVCGRPAETLRLMVPSLLYTIQNNLIFVALGHLEIVAFQVLYQAKLLITAVLSVIFLRHRLTSMQWFALLLLTVGVVTVELSTTEPKPAPLHERPRRGAKSSLSRGIGAAAALGAASLSSVAGVYFETIVKATESNAPSLWTRNVQLCTFSIPLALFGVLVAGPAVDSLEGLLTGFDWVVWLLVVLNASGGLVVAAVIKYGDNILKNFSTASSVVLGTLLSVVLFDFKPGLQFAFGAATVAIATFIYATNRLEQPTLKLPADEAEAEQISLVETSSSDAPKLERTIELRAPTEEPDVESRGEEKS